MKNTPESIHVVLEEMRNLRSEINNLRSGPAGKIKSQWITGIEVSHTLNMSARTLLRLRDCGALPFSKVHGKIFYKVSDVEQMLENNYHKVNRKNCACS